MAIADTRAWVEVDLEALRANYDTILRNLPDGTGMVPMVKADAYGLGVAGVVRALEGRQPRAYGVATAAEGAELRALGVSRPIWVLGPLPPADVERAAEARLTATVSSLREAEAWAAAAARVDGGLDVHVDVDTGMGRSGFLWKEVGAWAPALDGLGGAARWSGIFTHFHSGDEPDPAPTALQWERFRDTLVQVPVPRGRLMVHAAASAVAVRWPEYGLDAVRPGLFLYGGHPAPGTDTPVPAPVVSVRAQVLLVRDVPAGSTVGYGATYTAAGPERWATVALGYEDGVPRSLANRGRLLIRGRWAPIIGRVSMDLATVRVENGDVAAGDPATWIGRDAGEDAVLEDVAEQAGTIGYEILTGLGRRLPRVYHGANEESETR